MEFDLCEMGHLSRFHGSFVTLLRVICHAFEFHNLGRPKISWVICHENPRFFRHADGGRAVIHRRPSRAARSLGKQLETVTDDP